MPVRSRTEAKRGKGPRRRGQHPSRRILPPDKARSPHPLDRILLNGRWLRMQIGDRLTDATLERTTEGASTVTLAIWDGDRAVSRSGLFGDRFLYRRSRIQLDGLAYEITGLSRQGDLLSVTFEDQLIADLKRHGKGKPVRFSRGQYTRAQACATLLRQAGAKVIVLDENKVQPIAGHTKLRDELAKASGGIAREQKGRARAKGMSGAITIKGQPANSGQRRNLAIGMGVCDELNAPHGARKALLLAYIQESLAKNLSYGHSTSTGILQLLSSTAQALRVNPLDVAAVTRIFLQDGFWIHRPAGAIELARRPGLSAGTIAQMCQGSAGSGADYERHAREADAIIAAWGGGGLPAAGNLTTAITKDYAFDRRRGESTWACVKRLMDEVRWRVFVREGVVVIASDVALMRSVPSLELRERSESVESLDFTWHRALRVGEMTGRAYVGRWAVDPGEVVDVDGLPPIDRRWLLSSVRVSLLRTAKLADITLKAPQAPLKEPAPEVERTSAGGGGGSTGNGSVGERTGRWIWPTESHLLTSPFGPRWGRLHDGIDIGVPVGTVIRAVDGGTVTKALNNGGYGLYVEIAHGNGEVTFYAHLSRILVRSGEKVAQGAIVGRSGGAPGAPGAGSSTGPHLHFGYHVNGQARDPLSRLPR